MATGFVIKTKIICCPACLAKRKIKRFSRPMDVNQHLAKHHPDFKYKITGLKKLNGGFLWTRRIKLN